MKYIILAFLLFSSVIAFSQPTKLMMEGISKNDLSFANESLATWVILSINDKSSTIRKSDAISQLSSYLNIIQPTGYQRRHSGKTLGQKQSYTVANVSSIEGRHRLFVYAEDNNGLVKEIRLTAIQ